MVISGVRERLKEYIKYSGITTTEFERTIGASNGYVTSISKGIGAKFSREISKRYPDLNLDWLLSGEGDMLLRSDGISGIEIDDDDRFAEAKKQGLTIIPEYSEAFRGGPTGHVISSDKMGQLWGIPGIRADFIAEVEGDSMTPGYPPGTKLAFRELHFDPEAPTLGIPFGEVFGIITEPYEGEFVTYIKRLRRHKDKGLWVAHSDNTDKYDDFDIAVSQVRHLFVVVASIKLSRF